MWRRQSERAFCRWQALTFCLVGLGAAACAQADTVTGELDGLYVPQHGWLATQEISRLDLGEAPNWIGSYSLILVREGWDELPVTEQKRIRKLLGLKGSLRGVTNSRTSAINYALGTEMRNGVLYTEGDYPVPESGAASCSQGDSAVVVETLNFTMGRGVFGGLAGGSIQLYDTADNCSDQPEFRCHDATVIPGAGGIYFHPLGGADDQDRD